MVAPARSAHECAVSNTVVGTVASASYAIGMHNLARTARKVGFKCIVVMPFDWFDELRHELIVPLPVASPPLRPRQLWCVPPYNHQYGWRRSQLYRTRLWRVVLEMGLDLLALDLDHQLGSFNPVPFFHAIVSPAETFRWVHDIAANARVPDKTDVVAVWDGPSNRYLNVGVMWLRSTDRTRALTVRCENRTFAGWEQGIFNEEINFNIDLSSVRCCHSMCFKRLFATSKVAKALPSKSSKGDQVRLKSEGADRCTDEQPFAAMPPRGSHEVQVKKWTGVNETFRSKHMSNRRNGRCNHAGNACIILNSSGLPAFSAKDDENCTMHFSMVPGLGSLTTTPRDLIAGPNSGLEAPIITSFL